MRREKREICRTEHNMHTYDDNDNDKRRMAINLLSVIICTLDYWLHQKDVFLNKYLLYHQQRA